ncbi:hypothetical protein BDV98DRAFT_659466 [Pterulicium gracile]|uniref:DUF6535 domain-containing protein n=1 Tax=Pterulicium gracile TaxID=1884261 RepID=A0A5C3Q6R7_9AGAR|nr:hypothetical protein BDV98DRAFT_659466 [Pterula gracilis]
MTSQPASIATEELVDLDSAIQNTPKNPQKLQGDPQMSEADPSVIKAGVPVDAGDHNDPEATEKSTGPQNEDSSIPGLLALLGEDEYELYEVAPGSGAKKIDPPPDTKSLRRHKRPFIIRRKTAQKMAQEQAQFIGGEPQVADGEVDQLDYEKRFRPDKPGERLAQNARVWRVYLNEAGQFDVDMVEKMMDTVDVILIIAALFAAIVTTLVALTAAALQLDQPKVTNMLLMELIDLQRAQMGNGSINDIERYPITADSPATETASWTDYVATRLWFSSLALSMSTALIAMLVRQWIHSYDAPTFQGTAQKRAEIRHFRFYGFDAWNVPLIIHLLPTMLQLSLFLFFAGLVVYLHPLDRTIEILVAVLAFITFIVLLPIPSRWHTNHRAIPNPPYVASQQKRRPHSLKEMEITAIEAQEDVLHTRMFTWVMETSSNPSARSIITSCVALNPKNLAGIQPPITTDIEWAKTVHQAISDQVTKPDQELDRDSFNHKGLSVSWWDQQHIALLSAHEYTFLVIPSNARLHPGH